MLAPDVVVVPGISVLQAEDVLQLRCPHGGAGGQVQIEHPHMAGLLRQPEPLLALAQDFLGPAPLDKAGGLPGVQIQPLKVFRAWPVHIPELQRYHPQWRPVAADERGGLYRPVSSRGRYRPVGRVTLVRLDILDDDALSQTQCPAAGAVFLGGNFREKIQKFLAEAVLDRDLENSSRSVEKLYIAHVRAKQLDCRGKHFIESLAQAVCEPEAGACLIQSPQRGGFVGELDLALARRLFIAITINFLGSLTLIASAHSDFLARGSAVSTALGKMCSFQREVALSGYTT